VRPIDAEGHGVRALAAALLVAGCSAPALMPELERAEDLEKRGRSEEALAAYGSAIDRCASQPSYKRRARDCADAHLHRAELLVNLGREREAITAYERAAVAVRDVEARAAEATYRAGALQLERDEDEAGYRLLWKVVTDFPDTDFAADALRDLVIDGRRRNPEQLAAVLGRVATSLAGTGVADNALFAIAELAENELERPGEARKFYDQLVRDYPESGLFDESLWRGAKISRALGDGEGAARRLRDLLATREVALGAGSYFSVWLDDAQLELGVILRDDLRRLDDAAAAFERLPRDYPASILRDDALWELAVTRARARQIRRACRVLGQLAGRWPDSKYQLEKAPRLAGELGC
jgi:TolA-binding protein